MMPQMRSEPQGDPALADWTVGPALRGGAGRSGAGWENCGVSGQAGRYQRSAAGMVGAMIVLLVVVVAFVGFRDLNRDEPASPVRAVDYAVDARFARGEASFDLLAPERLPEGWIATTARYVPGSAERWHLGMLTDAERYVGLEQSAAPVTAMVAEHVDADAERGEPVGVDGAKWETWSDEGGDLALVRREAGITTLVVGHEVPVGVLVDFTASLR